MLPLNASLSIAQSPSTEQSNVLYPFMGGNKKIGFINRAGKVVIKPAFYSTEHGNEPWINDLLGVTVNRTGDSAGIINKEGKFVVEPVFYMARSINNGKALVYGSNFNNMVIDSKGQQLSTSLFDIQEPSEGKLLFRHLIFDGTYFYFNYGFLNESDFSLFIEPKLSFASPYSEGLAATYKGTHQLIDDGNYSLKPGGKWAYIDLEGNPVFETSYSVALPFNDGLAPVNQGGVGNVNIFGIFKVDGGVWGYIDRSGKTVVKPKYEYVYPFENGVARVQLNGKWGLINRSGKELTKIQYDRIEPFKDGLALATYIGKMGLLDTSGKAKIPFLYDELHNYSEDLAYARAGKVQGYLDRSGKFKFKTNFAVNSDFHEGLATVGISSGRQSGPIDKIGFIDKNGKIVIPLQFSREAVFKEGLAMVYLYKKGKEYQAYIDRTGKLVWTSSVDIDNNELPTAFYDVAANAYYTKAVIWAVEKGITNGTSATMFSPNKKCTTGEILTFLWKAQNSPEPTISNPYSDVTKSDYYYKAALWAYEKGLVSGSTFKASVPSTRSMTVTYLWKLAGKPTAGASNFTDVPSSADYAQAVSWAVGKGITSGTEKNIFSPDSTSTRGQIVTFLYRAFAQ